MDDKQRGTSPPYLLPQTLEQAKENFKYYRIAAGVSKSAIAKHCGVTPTSVGRWENHSSSAYIPIARLDEVAAILHADPKSLTTSWQQYDRLSTQNDGQVIDVYTGEVLTLNTAPQTKSDYKHNLRYFRIKKGLSQRHVADAMELKQSTISLWERLDTDNMPPLVKLAALSQYLDADASLISPLYAQDGPGMDDRLKRIASHAQNVLDVIQSDSDRIYDDSSNVDRISLLAENDPLLNLKSNVCVSAGDDMPYEMQFNATLGEMVGIKGGKGFAIAHVCGDSMFNPITGKGIPDGSVVLVDTSKRDPKLLVGKIVCFMRDGGCLIKRLRDNHGTLNAVSDNPRYFPIFFGQHEVIELLGEVVKVITDVE